MNHAELLKEIYNSALTLTSPDLGEEYQSLIQVIANNALNQTGIYTVLITLLTHKIIEPNQDIRFHQKGMLNGFAGRSIDTK